MGPAGSPPPQVDGFTDAINAPDRSSSLRWDQPKRKGRRAGSVAHLAGNFSPVFGGDILPGILPGERSSSDGNTTSPSTPSKSRHTLWSHIPRPSTMRGPAGSDESGSNGNTVEVRERSERKLLPHDKHDSPLRIRTESERTAVESSRVRSPVRSEGVVPRTSKPPPLQSIMAAGSLKSPTSPTTYKQTTEHSTRTSPSKVRAPVVSASSPIQLNARRLYRLMTTTNGKMQGDVLIWQKELNCWQPAYCYIDVAAGSFIQESSSSRPERMSLMADLRGCKIKVATDEETAARVLLVMTKLEDSNSTVHLRTENAADFDDWFAAFLCWNSVVPRLSLHSTGQRWSPKAMPWSADTTAKALGLSTGGKKAAAIKAGELSFLVMDDPPPAHAQSPIDFLPPSNSWKHWVKVYCILQQNGEFSLSRTGNLDPVARIDLSRVPRSAIQRLSPSVSGAEFGIAIYPQYSQSDDACSQLRPFFLALDSRPVFEAWYVLLRAMAQPVLYSAPRPSSLDPMQIFTFLPGISRQPSEPDLVRIASPASFRIMSARLRHFSHPKDSGVEHQSSDEGKASSRTPQSYYVEILHDGQVKARTNSKSEHSNPSWHESFEFQDWPTASSCVIVRICSHDSPKLNVTGAANPSSDAPGSPKVEVPEPNISILAETTIDLDEAAASKELNSWWPVEDSEGTTIGELMMEIKVSRDVVLMDKEFRELSGLAHNFTSALTIQMAERIPYALSKLSECLLNIFQVSGQAADWLMSLAEEEIDGVLKENATSRLRFNSRHDSDENLETAGSYNSSEEREALVRDLGKSVTQEANLLFRGNTIFSKALDLHMKRLGKEYLEETLGVILRRLNEQDLNCEVDPNKLKTSGDSDSELTRNWKRLIAVTEDVWRAIYRSAERCPQELRVIFRHVRACAHDRYGDFLRSVSYSSVSGFLFLRFFCAAILNPNMFGLVKTQPKARAKRTFTLIAKSLQGLANMTTFGSKELWMEHMNTFLLSHRGEFKDFIDTICAVSQPSTKLPTILPAYSTPYAMYSRVPPAVREGYLYLPYLICPTANCAALVNVWLDNYEGSVVRGNTDDTTWRAIPPLEGDLLRFHTTCVALRARAETLCAAVERVEIISSSTTQNWVVLAERIESHPEDFMATQLELAVDKEQVSKTLRHRSISMPPVGRMSAEEGRERSRHLLRGAASEKDNPWSGASSDNEQADLGSSRSKEKDKGEKSMLGIFGWMKKTGGR